MATIRLIPSAYTRSSTSRVTVNNPEYAYDNTSDTSDYAEFRGRNRSSNTYYAFLHGFNFDDVPSNAIVTGFRVLIRCYRNSYQSTGSTYRLRLASQANNSYVISGTTTSTDIDITVSVIEIPTGDLTWEQLANYGSDFSIEMILRPSSNNYPYIYVYGAEIEVTYTLPTPRTITTSINGTGTISPSGTTTVYNGDSFTLRINTTNPTVTDNNVNVTSQLERITSETSTFIPYDSEHSGFTISNLTNAYTDISGSTYADCSLAGRTTGTLYLDLGPIDIPSSTTILSVSCQASLQINSGTSQSSVTASCQMYSGNTAKGSSTTLVSGATNVPRTTYDMTVGTWTAAELQNARFYVTMYNGASSTVRHVYVYGISLVITYSISGEVYTYTISNVTGDHTIIVTQGASTQKIYIKQNGSWVQCSKVYKKINGSWVEQTNLSNVFDNSINYILDNN